MSNIDISKAHNSNAYFQISRIPNLRFFMKNIQLPGINNGKTRIPMPKGSSFYIPSVTNDTDDSTMVFYLDRDYKNYFAILNWMSEFKKNEGEPLYSDITITIVNNSKQPIINITMVDAWPVTISPIDFDTFAPDPVMPFLTVCSNYIKWNYVDGSMSGDFGDWTLYDPQTIKF